MLGTALTRLGQGRRGAARDGRGLPAAAGRGRGRVKRKFERDGLARQVSVATSRRGSPSGRPAAEQLIALEPDSGRTSRRRSARRSPRAARQRPRRRPTAPPRSSTPPTPKSTAAGRGVHRRRPDRGGPPRSGPLPGVGGDGETSACAALRESVGTWLSSAARRTRRVLPSLSPASHSRLARLHAQKSNCALTFHNRPSTMRCGCCHAAKLLFRMRSAFEFVTL